MNNNRPEEFPKIIEVDRRHFLKLAGGTLISLSGLSLIGCGGILGIGGTNGGLNRIGGTVQMPSGSSIDVSTLTVGNGFGSGNLSKSGGFSLSVVSVPTLAYVTNPAGNVILFGFVDPAVSTNKIDATSTAIALIYFGLDAYMIQGSATKALLDMIAQHSATATFAQVVAARVVANPLALDASDPQLCAALAAAITSIKNGTPGAKPQQTSRTTTNPLLLINGGTQSGFDLNQDGAKAAAIGVNQRRRWCKMYVYETATVDSAGVKTILTTPKQIGSTVPVSSTEALGLFTSLSSILSSTSPFSPVSSPSIPLPLAPGTSQTLYDVIVLGSSGLQVDPAFYSDPKYAGQLAGWRTDQGNLNLRTALIDILMGLVLAMIGTGGIATFPDASIEAAVAELEAIGDAAWQNAIAAAVSGRDPRGPTVKAAAYMLFGASFPATVAFTTGVFNACTKLNVIGNAAKGAAMTQARLGVIMAFGFKVIVGALTGASLALGVGDLAAVLKDFGSSDAGDLWTAAAVLPTIHLNPATVSITPGSSAPTSFTVSTAAGVTGTFVWTWTLTGGVTAQITDEAVPTAHQGTTLTDISAATIYLLTTPSDINPMTLSVEGFSVGTGGTLSSIGRAQASISVAPTANWAVRMYTETIPGNDFSDPTFANYFCYAYGFFTFPITPGATNYQLALPHDNFVNLKAADIAQLPVATDVLNFPDIAPGSGAGAPWGAFVQLGNGLLGYQFNTAQFPLPNTQYVSPDGILVFAGQTSVVFWRFNTTKGAKYDGVGTKKPLSNTEITDTLTYMSTVLQDFMNTSPAPKLTVT